MKYTVHTIQALQHCMRNEITSQITQHKFKLKATHYTIPWLSFQGIRTLLRTKSVQL